MLWYVYTLLTHIPSCGVSILHWHISHVVVCQYFIVTYRMLCCVYTPLPHIACCGVSILYWHISHAVLVVVVCGILYKELANIPFPTVSSIFSSQSFFQQMFSSRLIICRFCYPGLSGSAPFYRPVGLQIHHSYWTMPVHVTISSDKQQPWEASTQCWFDAGLSSQTVGQHQTNIAFVNFKFYRFFSQT